RRFASCSFTPHANMSTPIITYSAIGVSCSYTLQSAAPDCIASTAIPLIPAPVHCTSRAARAARSNSAGSTCPISASASATCARRRGIGVADDQLPLAAHVLPDPPRDVRAGQRFTHHDFHHHAPFTTPLHSRTA